jgi:hypothetical protein
MLKIIIFILLALPLCATAQALNLQCTAKHNLDLIVEEDIQLSSGVKNKLIGSFDDFRFYVSDKGDDMIEVHAYSISLSSRTYATARLKSSEDFVEASVWNREFMLDLRCTRQL